VPNARKYAERVSEGTIPGGGLFQTWRVFGQELMNGEVVVDSLISGHNLGFHQADFHNFGLWIRADSATGTPEFFIHTLHAPEDQQEAYAVYDQGIWVTSNIPQVIKLQVPPMRWMRIRLIGQEGNPPDTFVDAYLFMQRG